MIEMFHPLTIRDIRREAEDAISIAFDLSNGVAERFRFTPGQFLTLRATVGGEAVRRSYSICSGLDDGELRIAIRRLPQGVFSAFAHAALKVGDTLEAMPPEGRFGALTTASEAPRTYLAFAAGSGITPIMSLIKSYLGRQPNARFSLVYGNRTAATVMFKDALDDLKDRFLDRLAVHHVLSREKQDVELLDGRIDAAKVAAFLRLSGGPEAVAAVFLCGPNSMMDTARATLLAEGVEEAKIRREVFSTAGAPIVFRHGPEAAARAEDFATLSVRIDGVTHALTMARNETVLDAALRQGLDLPYSCHAGMCCTCRARIIDGQVEMVQNFSLEAWEMEAGFVLTCQSLPKTRTVSVDYDAA